MALSRTLIYAATVSAAGTATVTTASFTPSSNALMVVGCFYQRNGGSSANAWAPQAVLTNSAGLTFTLRGFQSNPNDDWDHGYAFWTTQVGTAVSMTLTLTTTDVMVDCAFFVYSYTGHNTSDPIGQKGGSCAAPPNGYLQVDLVAPTLSSSEVVALTAQEGGALTLAGMTQVDTVATSFTNPVYAAATSLTTTRLTYQGSVNAFGIEALVMEIRDASAPTRANSGGVWNPADASTRAVLTNGNRTIGDTLASYNPAMVRSVQQAPSSGLTYLEWEINAQTATGNQWIGIANGTKVLTGDLNDSGNATGLTTNNTVAPYQFIEYSTGNFNSLLGRRVCIAIDWTNQRWWFRGDYDNVFPQRWSGITGTTNVDPLTPASGLLFAISGVLITGSPLYLIGGPVDSTQTSTIYTSEIDWAYQPPPGYSEWHAPQTYNESVAETATAADTSYQYPMLYTLAFQENSVYFYPVSGGGGGTVYNVSISEAASALETITGILTMAMATAETASAVETTTGLLIIAGAMPETVTAAETTTGQLVIAGATTETAAAVDTISNIMTLVGAIAESGTAADTVTNNMVLVGSTVETGAATDTTTGNLVIPVSLAETASAVDTVAGGLVFLADVAEAASAVDAPACALSIFAFTSESGGATDTVAGNLSMNSAVAESLTAAETILSSIVMNMTIAESASAVDLSDINGTVYNVSVAEVASAVDLSSVAMTISASMVEAASAADTQTNVMTLVAFVSETASAQDTIVGSGGGSSTIYSVGGKYVTGRFLTVTVYYPNIGVTQQTDD